MLTTTNAGQPRAGSQNGAMPRIEPSSVHGSALPSQSSFKWDHGRAIGPTRLPWQRPVLGGPRSRRKEKLWTAGHTPGLPRLCTYLQTGTEISCKKRSREVSSSLRPVRRNPQGSVLGARGIPARSHWSGHQWSEAAARSRSKVPMPLYEPKPISRGDRLRRAKAISPVRGPMLTSSRKRRDRLQQEIKVGRGKRTTWSKYSITAEGRGWPIRKSARQTL